jgi:hypothetical protein
MMPAMSMVSPVCSIACAWALLGVAIASMA